MIAYRPDRRSFSLGLATLWSATAAPSLAVGRFAAITDFGALADGETINTKAIQSAIDHLADAGGGTLLIPRGIFVCGALFLKPGIHLHLDNGAVLRCSTNPDDFPKQRTRIEGHFEDHFNPALINASTCDGLKITGQGTLDGHGRPVWDRFWNERAASPDPANFPNLSMPRARLMLIENSSQVTIEGITFKDSQFWNLHLYRCANVTISRARFEVPDDYKQAPSTDGIDLDSCRDVLITGCDFSVTDDCIVAKGTKGPHALDDKDSPPVERIRVRNCVFRRGHGVMTFGSEATIVRDVIVEDCRVTGAIKLAVFKLRPDTPQTFGHITFRNIRLDADGGSLLDIRPWRQYASQTDAPVLTSAVHDVRLIGITGRFGALGAILPIDGRSRIEGIVMRDVRLQLRDGTMRDGRPLAAMKNVWINGQLID